MRVVTLTALLALAACSSSTDPGAPDTPIDYRVSIQSGTGEVFGSNVAIPVTAVVRLPSGEFAHDVTVKWEANMGNYAHETNTGSDSASTVDWRFTVPQATDATMRACATHPVDRPCTYYSGTITVNTN